jgi:DNA-binding ferritin-like protein
MPVGFPGGNRRLRRHDGEGVLRLVGPHSERPRSSQKSRPCRPYPTDIYAIKDHLAALIEHYGRVGKATRRAIDAAAEAGDADTADIFAAASRGLNKALWFQEAHFGAALAHSGDMLPDGYPILVVM